MRLYVKHIWRAFPELDRFSDEQCRRFTRAARRSRPVWLRCGHWVFQWAAWAGCAAGGLLLAGLLERLTWRSDAALTATYVWIAVSGLAMLLMAVLGAFAWLWLSHVFLRRRITWVLRARGRCGSCGYVLVGLPVDRELRVVCPECGMEAHVDRSLGELSVGTDGQERYTPSEEVVKRSAPWLTWKRVRPWLKWGAYSAGALLVVAAGVFAFNELRLTRQAARASKLAIGSQRVNEILGRVEEAGRNEDRGVTAVELLASLRKKMLAASGAAFPSGWPGDPLDGSYISSRGERSEYWAASLAANEPPSRRLLAEMERASMFEDVAALGRARVSGVTFSQPPGEPLASLEPLPGSDFRSIARWSAARMRVAWDEHDPVKFEAALKEILGIASLQERLPSGVMRSNCWGLESLAYAETMWVLQQHPGRDWLDAADRALAAFALGGLKRLPFEGEKERVADTVRWLFADASLVRWGNRNPSLRSEVERRRLVMYRVGTLEENLAAVESVFGSLMMRAEQGRWERTPFDSAVGEERGLLADGEGRILEAMLNSQDAADARRGGVRIVAAIERFRLERGRLPTTLEELTPAYLKAVPVDPCTGRPLLYKPVDPAGDPQKRSYLVYSTGADGVDNGATNGGWNAFSPKQARGLDFVVNDYR